MKVRQLEKKRYSVFTDDLKTCIICNKPKNDLHEVLYGSNRLNSIKYGYVIPVCRNCHIWLHKDHNFTLFWVRKCQRHFELDHDREEWLKIFKKNYLD